MQITDVTFPARACLGTGVEGIAAINTIQSVMGINLATLRPEPSVEGYSTPGGYSSRAVKPIALAKVCLCLHCAIAVIGLATLEQRVVIGAAIITLARRLHPGVYHDIVHQPRSMSLHN